MLPPYRPSDIPHEIPIGTLPPAPSSASPLSVGAPPSSRPGAPAVTRRLLVKRFFVSFAATLVIGGIPVALSGTPGGGALLGTLTARAATRPVVVVGGSSTIAELGRPASAALASAHPGLGLRYEVSSSGGGLGGLVRGEIEIAASSRPASDAEKAAAEKAGHHLVEHVIGRDGIAVVVHPDNPVSALTLEQLRGVLTGRITNWSELGGRKARINLLVRPEEQGSHEVIKAAVLDHGEAYASNAEVVRKTDDVSARVRLDPDAIGYVSFLGTGSAKALKLTAGSVNAVPPSAATIRSGAYPLRRDLFLYTRENASPNAREVVRFLMGPGQSVVREAGFVTLE